MIRPDTTYTKQTAAENGFPRKSQIKAMELGMLHPLQFGSTYVFKGEEIIAAQLALGKPVALRSKEERIATHRNASTFTKRINRS